MYELWGERNDDLTLTETCLFSTPLFFHKHLYILLHYLDSMLHDGARHRNVAWVSFSIMFCFGVVYSD